MEQIEQTAEELGVKLLPQHRAWADAYIRTMNRRRASVDAGYSEDSADSTGWRLYRRPDIRAYLEAVFRESRMPAEEVMKRLLEHATLDLDEITVVEEIKDDKGRLLRSLLVIDPVKLKEKGYARFLRSVGFDSNGNPKYEFIDPQAALRDLGRAHKLFGEANTLSGPGGGTIPVSMEIVFRKPSEGQQHPEPESGQALLERIEAAASQRGSTLIDSSAEG